jgi:hypothetical protein
MRLSEPRGNVFIDNASSLSITMASVLCPERLVVALGLLPSKRAINRLSEGVKS